MLIYNVISNRYNLYGDCDILKVKIRVKHLTEKCKYIPSYEVSLQQASHIIYSFGRALSTSCADYLWIGGLSARLCSRHVLIFYHKIILHFCFYLITIIIQSKLRGTLRGDERNKLCIIVSTNMSS